MKNGQHILIASDSGTGKTRFASTIIQPRNPRPVLVQAFDPSDKLVAYRRRGDCRIEEWEYGTREIVARGETTLAVIERWHEQHGRGSPGMTMKGGKRVPTTKHDLVGRRFEAYLERMKHFDEETDDWYAMVLDSSTFLELSVRAYLGGVMNVKDNQMIWGQATDELERLLMFVLPDLPITTIVLSHVGVAQDRGEDGKDKYQLRLPGRLGKDPYAAFGEIYRAYVARSRNDGELVTEYLLQTRADNAWRCGSQLEVPDPMEPHWKHIVAACQEAGLDPWQ